MFSLFKQSQFASSCLLAIQILLHFVCFVPGVVTKRRHGPMQRGRTKTRKYMQGMECITQPSANQSMRQASTAGTTNCLKLSPILWRQEA